MSERLTREQILGALARGYCTERNEHKQLDADLLAAQADEIMALAAPSKREAAIEECGDIAPALENLLVMQAAYARGDNTSRAQRDVARKAFNAELKAYIRTATARALASGPNNAQKSDDEIDMPYSGSMERKI